MADDILGHEHLDHGKHLQHHAKHWAPGDRFARGNRPVHIGLAGANPLTQRHPNAYSVHTDDAHAHLHVHHDFAHAHASSRVATSDHAHGNENAVGTGKPLLTRLQAALPWFIAACVALPIGILLFRSYPAFSTLLIIIIVNTLVEYHKFLSEGIPIDFEILFSSAAALAMTYGAAWSIALVLIAPTIAVAARGHDWDTVPRKTGGLLVTVAVASFLAPSLFGLLTAITAGVLVHYAIIVLAGKNNGFNTIAARLTVLGMNCYLATFLLPMLLGIR